MSGGCVLVSNGIFCDVNIPPLQALVDVSDVKIFLSVMSGEEEDSTMKGAMEGMLTNLLLEGLTDQKTILKYIGEF